MPAPTSRMSLGTGILVFAVGFCIFLLWVGQRATVADDRQPTYEAHGILTPNGASAPAFKAIRMEKPNAKGGVEIDVKYLDQKGETAMIEHAVLGPNAEVLEYTFDQKQLGQRGSVTRLQNPNGKDQIRLSFTPKGKPTATRQEEASSNLVVGASLVPYLFKHREEILDGKELIVRLAVPEQQDTYGFSIRHRGRADWKGQEVARVEMLPTSFIIRQFLDPMSFFMDLDVRVLLGYSGRMSVYTRKSETSGWDTMQGLAEYKAPLGEKPRIQATSSKSSRPE